MTAYVRSLDATSLKLCIVALSTVLVTACGGGGGDEANENANSAVAYALAGTGTPSAANGKTLYASACSGCHSAYFPNARDSNRTLAAIAANRGGMGALSTSIKTQQSDDIAAFLAGV